MPLTRRAVVASLGAAAAGLLTRSLGAATNPDWTTPLPPFRIASNLYYVGSRDLASYLIVTPQGHVLINSDLATSPQQIKASIEKLGFHYRDLKILLISHAHYDHCAGSAQILRETGAKYMVMEGDADVVESGGKADFHFGSDPAMRFPAAKVARILKDRDTVELGGTVLTARKTAGHTKGCTTWTMTLPASQTDALPHLNVVIVGGPYVLESYNLIDDPKYPRMAADFTHQFEVLKYLPCDLFLGAHGSYFGLLGKYARFKNGDLKAFLDSKGYQSAVSDWQKDFEQTLVTQKAKRQAHSAKPKTS